MGLFSNLLKNRSVVVIGDVVTIRSAELASTLRRPTAPCREAPPQAPCEKCKKPLVEALITTGGAAADANVWRDHPVAVDGWACASCAVFRFPRPTSAEAIVELVERGIAAMQAGRHDEAELALARAVWDLPGYGPAHVNYGDAIRARLRTTRALDPATRRKYERRMSDEYELAMQAKDGQEEARAHACIRIAEIALGEKAFDRARRALETCLTIRGARPGAHALARELLEYADQRLDLLAEATEVLESRISLANRPLRPPETPEERKQMADAIEKLETHIELAPKRWQSRWLHAKALFVLERGSEGLAAFAAAHEAFPRERAIAIDYAMELLRADRVSDAREVSRALTKHAKDDPDAWSNLATCELLAGDLAAAEAAADRCLALDEKHAVARRLRKRILGCKNGKERPRTLVELTRGS